MWAPLKALFVRHNKKLLNVTSCRCPDYIINTGTFSFRSKNKVYFTKTCFSKTRLRAHGYIYEQIHCVTSVYSIAQDIYVVMVIFLCMEFLIFYGHHLFV